MKIGKTFKAFKGIRSAVSNQRDPAQWLLEFFGSTSSKTGVNVSTTSVLGLASVIHATNKISGHIAQLPIKVYEEGNPSEIRRQSPAYRLLNRRPNNIMTSFTMREVMMIHALINGNGRAFIDRNSIGTPTQLIPILPESCQTIYAGGEKWHLISKIAGTPQEAISDMWVQGEYYKVRDRDVLHIMNTSYNGIWGMHLIELAADVFGLTQAAQDATAITMANSGRPGILLEAPPGMFRNAKDAEEFLKNFNAKHEGVSNAGKAGMLRDGIKATTIPVSASDAQFLEQRGFQREEIALLFGLESIMGDRSAVTYRSISERNTAYINNCLQRWFSKWESEIEDKLFNSTRQYVAEFDTTMLAKGDPNNLADYSLKMQQTGSITINEIRYMHGLEPVEGGDVLPYQIEERAAQQALDAKQDEPKDDSEGDQTQPQPNEENENDS